MRANAGPVTYTGRRIPRLSRTGSHEAVQLGRPAGRRCGMLPAGLPDAPMPKITIGARKMPAGQHGPDKLAHVIRAAPLRPAGSVVTES